MGGALTVPLRHTASALSKVNSKHLNSKQDRVERLGETSSYRRRLSVVHHESPVVRHSISSLAEGSRPLNSNGMVPIPEGGAESWHDDTISSFKAALMGRAVKRDEAVEIMQSHGIHILPPIGKANKRKKNRVSPEGTGSGKHEVTWAELECAATRVLCYVPISGLRARLREHRSIDRPWYVLRLRLKHILQGIIPQKDIEGAIADIVANSELPPPPSRCSSPRRRSIDNSDMNERDYSSYEVQAQDAQGGDVHILEIYRYLLSAANGIEQSDTTHVYQAMDQPLKDYFISCSHNTYCVGLQYADISSARMYTKALRMGFRCIEVDCQRGAQAGEVVVVHGNAISSLSVEVTTSVPLKEVLETIKDDAFTTSEYPLIICFDLFGLGAEEQQTLAQDLVEVFGSMLQVAEGVSVKENESPIGKVNEAVPIEGVQREIGEGHNAEAESVKECEEEDSNTVTEAAEVHEPRDGAKEGGSHGKEGGGGGIENGIEDGDLAADDSTPEKGDSTAPAQEACRQPGCSVNMSPQELKGKILVGGGKGFTENCLNRLVALRIIPQERFSGERDAGSLDTIMNSDEGKAMKSVQSNPSSWVEQTQDELHRMYPWGFRVVSTNFDPAPAWQAGVQLTAMNIQRGDPLMWRNQAMFRDNGGCGYVLRPSINPSPGFRLKLTLVAGFHLTGGNAALMETVDRELDVSEALFPTTNGDDENGDSPIQRPPIHRPRGVSVLTATPSKKAGSKAKKAIDPRMLYRCRVDVSAPTFEVGYVSEARRQFAGLVCVWNMSMEMVMKDPELTFITIGVMGGRGSGRRGGHKGLVGHCCLKASMMREGYRNAMLRDAHGGPLNARLMLRVQQSPI